MWRVIRIYPQPTSDSMLLCMSGEEATTVQLYDDTTRKTDTVVVCFRTEPGHDCSNLELLTSAGYVPNDWDEACGA